MLVDYFGLEKYKSNNRNPHNKKMKDQIIFKLTKREIQVVRYWRKLKFGKLEIIIHGKEPTKICQAREEITLNGNIPLTAPLDKE